MPSTLELCEQYFGTKDLYELLEIEKGSLEKDIKKAYYKLSLKVHPDRVKNEEKEEATEKFKVLAKVHQVLTDKSRRDLYDEKGIIDDDDDEGKLAGWLEIWRKIFKPISVEDIDNYQKEYVGSELERNDIKKAYLNGKGCINYMMNCIPFMQVEDEPRIQEIVKKMIDAEEVPQYQIFTNEPKTKRVRRHKKYAREQKEAEEIKSKMKEEQKGSLEQQLMKRQQDRLSNSESFFNQLLEKYGGVDDSEEYDFEDAVKKKRGSKAKGSKGKPQKASKAEDAKPAANRVKNGRVTKKK